MHTSPRLSWFHFKQGQILTSHFHSIVQLGLQSSLFVSSWHLKPTNRPTLLEYLFEVPLDSLRTWLSCRWLFVPWRLWGHVPVLEGQHAASEPKTNNPSARSAEAGFCFLPPQCLDVDVGPRGRCFFGGTAVAGPAGGESGRIPAFGGRCCHLWISERGLDLQVDTANTPGSAPPRAPHANNLPKTSMYSHNRRTDSRQSSGPERASIFVQMKLESQSTACLKIHATIQWTDLQYSRCHTCVFKFTFPKK